MNSGDGLTEPRMGDWVRVVVRDLARRDIEESIDWYRDNVDADTALAFVDALDAALDHVGRHPGSGSPRYATELDLPGLRSWLLDGVPHMVFYVERDDHVDVWRVLHAHRDIPSWLLATETSPDDDEA